MGAADVKNMKRLVNILSKSKHRFIVSKGPFHEEYDLPVNMWGAATVPQIQVLPVVDLVVTHGGNNTTTETMYFGIPMIVLPLFLDQYDNAQRVEDKGFGIRLDAYQCSDLESTLPPGPLPLPILGNLLRETKSHFDEVFRQLAKQYGPVFTFWLGNRPHVIVSDIGLAREAFKKNDFAGRSITFFDVIFDDYGHRWEALRRVAHSAVQKYSRNDKLVNVANDSVDRMVKTMIETEGPGKAFDPKTYIYLVFLNIFATSAFGISYNLDDYEFKRIKYILKDFSKKAGSRLLLWEFSPLIRLLDRKLVIEKDDNIIEFIDICQKKFVSHQKDYSESIERDFCDALITAKNEALREGKESVPYLTDANLTMTSHWDEVFRQLAKQYGPVLTFWLGNRPHVIVSDIGLAREAFKKNDFAGRSITFFGHLLSNEKHSDVIFDDYGHRWEALRRVAHSAVQKYSTNDRLVNVANDSVDRMVKTMIETEGPGKAFDPKTYIYLVFLNILATSAFGISYNLEDYEFKRIKYILKDFSKKAGSRLLLWEFSPLIRLLDRKLVKENDDNVIEFIDICQKKFVSHQKDYSESIERDFCDALITAKNEALREDICQKKFVSHQKDYSESIETLKTLREYWRFLLRESLPFLSQGIECLRLECY
ncbi:unnamed protein product [Oppiella nova]|uniref:Glucuronosyltransferase n=1 Tax=Oppiella nova TaxID=334625 RepID=A0A7R9LM50_9ACAR|nr:unnamed protein product [Oppiella nova]CAG2165010.1 unnamed protein product [Oppiella nova]